MSPNPFTYILRGLLPSSDEENDGIWKRAAWRTGAELEVVHGRFLGAGRRSLKLGRSKVAEERSWVIELGEGGIRTTGAPPLEARAWTAWASFGGARQDGTTVELAFLGLEPDGGEVPRAADAFLASVSVAPYR